MSRASKLASGTGVSKICRMSVVKLHFPGNQKGKERAIFGADCVGEQILYMVFPRPHKAWEDFGKRHIPYLLDMNANPAYERWPDPDQPIRKLRFFPILHGIDVVSRRRVSLFFHLPMLTDSTSHRSATMNILSSCSRSAAWILPSSGLTYTCVCTAPAGSPFSTKESLNCSPNPFTWNPGWERLGPALDTCQARLGGKYHRCRGVETRPGGLRLG